MNKEQARNHLAEWLDEKMWRCFGTIDREAISIAVEALTDRPYGEWVEPQLIYTDAHKVTCTNCGGRVVIVGETNFCPNCGAIMESEKEYLNKTFPEHEGGEWFDITDMMTREGEE